MSEQVSPSTGGGLLSLNLSITPQGSPSAASGTVPLLGGFGAVLNQQTDSGVPVAKFSGGGMLPPEGEALPQKLEQLLPEEQMQDQLRQIAQLLEQQSAKDSELPPELSAELARALRQYTEQQPIMPVTGDSAKEVGSDPKNAGSDKVVSVPTNPGVATVAGGDQVVVTPPPKTAPLDPNAKVASDQQKIVAMPANDNSGQASSVETVKAQGQQSEAVSNTAATQSGSQNSAQFAEVQGPTQNTVAKDSAPAANASAPNAQSQSQQNVQQPQTLTNSATDVPKSQQASAGDPLAKPDAPTGNTPSDVKATQVKAEGSVAATDVDEVKPFDSAIRKAEIDTVKPANRTVAESSTAAPGAKSEFLLNLQADNSSVKKIESALDMTQRLMQKVAASEKGDLTATQVVERLASNTIGQVNSASPTAAQKVVTDGQNLMMPQNVKVNTPAWNNALGERAIMIAAQNTRVAEIKLDPPELGSLNIRVNINQDQVSLNFTSPHAHVRDAVEQSLPRLREMFAEQGLALQDSSVSDQSAEQQRREQFAEGNGSGNQYGGSVGAEGEESAQPENARSVSLVDYYA